MGSDNTARQSMLRGAIVEEHVLQRNRAAHLLEASADMEVVHSGDTVVSFLTWLREQPRSRWPHVLVLEATSRKRSPRDVKAVSALRAAGMRVVLLSALGSDTSAYQMARNGVDGVVSKRDSEEDFLDAVAQVLEGKTIVTDAAAAAMPDTSTAPVLSAQEARVLELYASGMTIAEAAEAIGVRQDTARKYLSRVKQKYATVGRPARSKLELAQRAWHDGYAHQRIDEPDTGA